MSEINNVLKHYGYRQVKIEDLLTNKPVFLITYPIHRNFVYCQPKNFEECCQYKLGWSPYSHKDVIKFYLDKQLSVDLCQFALEEILDINHPTAIEKRELTGNYRIFVVEDPDILPAYMKKVDLNSTLFNYTTFLSDCNRVYLIDSDGYGYFANSEYYNSTQIVKPSEALNTPRPEWAYKVLWINR